MIYGFFNGLNNDNNFNFIINDIKVYLSLLMVPVAICLLDSKERIDILMKCIVVATTFLSVIAIGIFIISPLIGENSINTLNVFINDYHFGGLSLIGRDTVSVFFRSTVFNICACCICLYYAFTSNKKFICNISLFFYCV